MEMNDFLKKFAEQLDEVSFEDLTPQTEFRKLDEWTSLTALIVITMIDEEYGITITGDDMVKSVTIADLYNIISSRL